MSPAPPLSWSRNGTTPRTRANAEPDSDAEPPDAEGGEYKDDEETHPEPVKVFVPVWVVTDAIAVEEAGYVVPRYALGGSAEQPEEETDEQVEARREDRRRVIANNKAWTSAETVRRDWLAKFMVRKTPPKGGEALICEAVLTGQHSLYKAMKFNHPRLRSLLGAGADKSHWDSGDVLARITAKASSQKATTMTTLAAVIAAWDDSTSTRTWRGPSAWDARVLGALIEWGYEASEVERILLGHDDSTSDSTVAAA